MMETHKVAADTAAAEAFQPIVHVLCVQVASTVQYFSLP